MCKINFDFFSKMLVLKTTEEQRGVHNFILKNLFLCFSEATTHYLWKAVHVLLKLSHKGLCYLRFQLPKASVNLLRCTKLSLQPPRYQFAEWWHQIFSLPCETLKASLQNDSPLTLASLSENASVFHTRLLLKKWGTRASRNQSFKWEGRKILVKNCICAYII